MEGVERSTAQARWYVCRCWCLRERSASEQDLVSGRITECVPCEVRRKSGMPVFDPPCGECGGSAVWVKGEERLCKVCFEREYGGG